MIIDSSIGISPVEIKAAISCWLDQLSTDLPLGRFRFCLNGSSVPFKGDLGQFTTCFAMKIAWQTGVWSDWSQEKKDACIKFVQSFQRDDGYFFDSWLHANSKPTLRDFVSVLLGKSSWHNFRNKNFNNLRAETRQSASTLLMVGASPLNVLPFEAVTSDDVKKYLRKLDWTNPWSAGSHFSHLVFFLTVNSRCFGIPENLDELITVCLDSINKYFDIESGTWFAGNPPEDIKINGAMKILTALQWVKKPYPDLSRLMDFALNQDFIPDACGFLNRLFVVQQASKGVAIDYKITDRLNLAYHSLEKLKDFRSSDGGFSFFYNKTQVNYYSAKVSEGFPVSDLHGTVMITWAIAIALEMISEIGNREHYGWVGQKP